LFKTLNAKAGYHAAYIFEFQTGWNWSLIPAFAPNHRACFLSGGS
jgi:hypothetical protein